MRRFWPTCPYEVCLLTDRVPRSETHRYGYGGFTYILESESWCRIVADFAARHGDQPILLMQEDFFINAPVNELLIVNGLQQLEERKAAMVRIYPCPGGDIPYGDKWYAEIPKGAPYRVSCQASIWRPDALYRIASQCETPSDFEIKGSKLSNDFEEPFIAFRRDVSSWPINYFCSAITRGEWEPAALQFCRANGIEVDTSMREVA